MIVGTHPHTLIIDDPYADDVADETGQKFRSWMLAVYGEKLKSWHYPIIYGLARIHARDLKR